MSNAGQSVEKTEQELFEEISNQLRSGNHTEIDKLMEAEVVITPSEKVEVEDEVVEEVTGKVAEEKPKTETVEKEETEPKSTVAKESERPEDQSDWTAGLPEEAKAKVQALMEERKQLEHRVKSELGRVPYLQRKVEELSRQLSEPPATKKPEAAQKTSVPQGKFAEKLAQIKQVDPELAETLELMAQEVILPLREETVNEIRQTQAMFKDKQEEELWHREKSKLLSMYPQADEVFRHPMYRDWKAMQSEGIQRLAGSIYADEVSIALEQFAKYVETQFPEMAKQPASQATATEQTGATPPAAAKVVAERARKLSATTPSTKTGAPKTSDLPKTEAELFEYYTQKIRKGEKI